MMADEDEWQQLLAKAKDGQLSEHELDQVVSVLKESPLKADDDALEIAVSVACEFIRNTWNDRLFESLLGMATNENNSHELRASVILTLAQAVGGGNDNPSIAEDEWHRSEFDHAFKKLLGRNE
jgi:hypothetical protein